MAANDKQIGGNHYVAPIQHWDFITDNGFSYLRGCATKYLARWRKKNGVEDLRKAQHYVEKLRECLSLGKDSPAPQMSTNPCIKFLKANDIPEAEHDPFFQILYGRTVAELDEAIQTIEKMVADA